MEFSEIFGFVKIWSQTMKNFLKNAKFIASIAAVSLLLSTLLFLLYSFSFRSITSYRTNSTAYSAAIFFALFFSIELIFLLSYVAIARLAWITTVIATAASYTGAELSLSDLFSDVRSKWRNPFRNTYRRSGILTGFLCVAVVAVAVAAEVYYPEPATTAIVSALVVAIFVYLLYESVVRAVAALIPVVEDGCEAAEAAERAEKLVEGQRLHGFLAHLLTYVLVVIVWLGFWMIVGNIGRLNLTVYGLFIVDSAMAMTIFLSGVYTVYYFRCREYHGEEIQSPGNYTALPSNIP